MAQEPLYVGIPNPVLLRKNILLCARDVISSLKNYEVYKEKSKIAIETTFELRRVMEEIVVLNKKLRKLFPKSKIVKSAPVSKKNVSNRTTTKLSDLENALDKIEGALKDMK